MTLWKSYSFYKKYIHVLVLIGKWIRIILFFNVIKIVDWFDSCI